MERAWRPERRRAAAFRRCRFEVHVVAFVGGLVVAPDRKLLLEGLGTSGSLLAGATGTDIAQGQHHAFGSHIVLREYGSCVLFHLDD